MTDTDTDTDDGAGSLAEFHRTLRENAIWPFWEISDEVMLSEPCAPDAARIWRWKDLLPFIDEAGRTVSMDNAERRALMLVNPDFGGRTATTTNLYAGIQILEPGEAALPHRHTPSAMRFIKEGGGTTTVNGQVCEMLPGDLILTPNWAWHEHRNDTDRRVVWLDALDIAIATILGPMFMEHGNSNQIDQDMSALPDPAFANGGYAPDTTAPSTPYSPMFRYPWERTLDALRAVPPAHDGARRVRYTNPVDGGPVIMSMDCYAWELRKNQETRPTRTTSNAIVTVVEGQGRSTIGDETIDWQKHDVFTVPHWNWTTHNAASETARLFVYTDREVLRLFNFLRDEVRD